MSELVTKPIAVVELAGFARAQPTLRNRLVTIRSTTTLNYAFGSVPGGVDGIHWLIDGSVRPFGPSSF